MPPHSGEETHIAMMSQQECTNSLNHSSMNTPAITNRLKKVLVLDCNILPLEQKQSSNNASNQESDAIGGDHLEEDTSIAFVDANNQNRHITTINRKTVTFSKIHVREHVVDVGDHPFCKEGLPLTLGWETTKEFETRVDDYEKTRDQQKPLQRLSYKTRYGILTQHLKRDDIKRALRKVSKERRRLPCCCRQQRNQVDASFFQETFDCH